MIRRWALGAAGAALAIGVVIAVPQTAWAKDDKSVSERKDGESRILKDAISTWTGSVKAYKSAVALRDKALKGINESFMKSIARAKAEFASADARAKTPSERSNAQARFRDAINRATATRQAAIDALPALPLAPGAKPTSKSLRSPSASPTPVA